MYGQLFCVLLNGVKYTMEIDTEASTTVVNEKTFHNLVQSESAFKLSVVDNALRT